MCKTIKQKVNFQAPPQTVYELLTNSKKHRAFSGKSADIGQKVGDKFSVYSGHATGIIVDLKPAQRLVQAWRSKDFPEGIFSMAAFTLSRTSRGGTELVLTHRGVPKSLIPRVESGWKKYYWQPMKEYLQQRSG